MRCFYLHKSDLNMAESNMYEGTVGNCVWRKQCPRLEANATLRPELLCN